MYSYGTNVLFVCRLCKDSFQLIDDFIEHKKEDHSVEFRTSNCIVFEDILILNTCNDEEKNCGTLSTVKEKGNPVPSLNVPLVGIENNLTEVDLSHSHEPIQHDPADAFDPFPVSMPDYQNYDNPENFSFQDDDETCDNSLEPNNDDYEAFDLTQVSADASYNFIEQKMELTDFENDQKINKTAINVTTQSLQNPNVLLLKLSPMEIQNYSRLQNQDTVQAADEVISESQCKLCPKKFNSAGELEIHGRVCILDNNKQDRYCFTCEKLFSSKRLQNIHTIKHHGTEDEQRELCIFKCNQCSSYFLTEHKLRQHEASHGLGRPFQCTEPGCGKAFKRLPYLRKHLKYLHSNILELFKCPERNCTSTSAFKRKEDLGRHLRMCHKTEPIP